MISSTLSLESSSMNSGLRVLLFGTFDPLHEGHHHFFTQAAALGDHLTVVVARDATIQFQKRRSSSMPEHERLARVMQDASVDEAVLGDADPNSYALLATLRFDVLALGYDQAPSDSEAQEILDSMGLSHAKIVRLAAYMPKIYKSSLLRA